MTFKREERYYVLKISDMRKYLSREKFELVGAIAEKLNAGRAVDGKSLLQAVVVEHDWPEYERVWQMIETRVVTTRRNFLNCNNNRRFWPIPNPKPWITLTDEEVQEIGNEVHRSMPNDADELMELLAIYHEIESRLCEKNMPVQHPEQAPVDGATLAGLETSVSILSALVDEQRTILVDVERVCGVDDRGGQFEDGESELIDRVRAHLAITTPAQLKEQLQAPAVDENTSDGYHTFKELYEYRKAYNIALFNEWAASGKCSVHKSWRHNDGELCFGGGWFIVVAVLPQGQISNHYEAKDWDLFQIQETEKALFEFDGHTGANVIERLKMYPTPPQLKPMTDEVLDLSIKGEV